jgi:hypothetical protein
MTTDGTGPGDPGQAPFAPPAGGTAPADRSAAPPVPPSSAAPASPAPSAPPTSPQPGPQYPAAPSSAPRYAPPQYPAQPYSAPQYSAPRYESPPQYRSAPQYPAQDQYGSTPQYGSAPQYASAPQHDQAQHQVQYGSAQAQYGPPAAWQWSQGEVASIPPRLPVRVKAGAAVLVLIALAAGAGGVAISGSNSSAAAAHSSGLAAQDEQVRALWRTSPADDLLPLSLSREGTETYQRIAVDPDEQCSILPAAMLAAMSPAGCDRVVQATYVDRTQTVTATVGIVVLSGTPAQRAALFKNWTPDSDATNTALMPDAYPVPGTAAADFQDPQRVAWESQVSADGSYLVYTVTGFTDGRVGPTAAQRAAGSGTALESDSPPVQVAADLPAAIQQILAARETAILGTSGS